MNDLCHRYIYSRIFVGIKTRSTTCNLNKHSKFLSDQKIPKHISYKSNSHYSAIERRTLGDYLRKHDFSKKPVKCHKVLGFD